VKGEGLVIRPWREGDLTGLAKLYREFPGAQHTAAESELHRRWQTIKTSGIIRGILGELDGKIVATCTLLLVPNLAGPSAAVGYIEHVITAADHRRRGFGTAVLRAAVDLAWREGCYKVMLMTDSQNPGTHAFYEGVGFTKGASTAFVARP
jgi:RimJ/RimL family protein N-acetyltransferase